jgi:PAS domain S-box-containing protein
MWHALSQIVPHVDSPDTLGTTIATALHQMVSAGRAAVILQGHPLEPRPSDDSETVTYFLRLVSEDTTPSHPIYLNGAKGILAQLAEFDEPFTLSAPWPGEYAAADDELLQLARESVTITPIPGSDLQAKSSPRGALCLLDVPQDGLPSSAELIGLASFTGVALNLLDSKVQVARQAVEYNVISKIGQSLTSTLSLDEIFQQILFSVRAAIGAAAVSVGLIDEETQELVLEKSMMGPEFDALPPIRLKMGQGIAGWVAKTGQPLNVPDAYAEPRFFRGADSASGFTTRSILCVPLIVEGQVIGVMQALNKHSGHFSEGDERLLSALASSAAIAIEKACLHADVLAEKRRMETIFANMSEGLLTVRPNGQITAVNPALRNMIGDDGDNLVGRYCYEAISTDPDTIGSLLDHMQAAESQAETFHAACDILRGDGGRVPVLVSGAATYDSSGDASEVVIVFSDIGQLRELERMKEDFVANVTHELRTPLATILLYARLLRSGKAKGSPEREARYLEIVEQQSNQIQKMIRQILDLSSMEAKVAYPRQDRVQLRTLLDDLLVSFQTLADQKGLAIRDEVPADLPAVVGQREALRLILLNLIDNAIKFTPEGEIRINATRQGDQVQLEVADEGIGISPESVPYLFQRFYRTRAAVERGIGGTGLGLALVKEAVEKLEGDISVQSRPGHGSTFTVRLPIADQK